ncbi:ABC transporter ATP-binding protein [Caenispirillum bisanense]|uniref:ABC transporter ATP-binding protein n=1 Tax=Caenispirillum bisanense TaxID=414052 RepID=UPI0031E0E9D1
MLEARDLRKSFGALVATDGLSLMVEHGRIHALIGPNGAGKSTALAQLGGSLRPDEGDIRLDGRSITAVDEAGRARLGIARSFQISALFPEMTALESVMMAVQATRPHHARFWRPARSDSGLVEPARAALYNLGIGHLARTRAGELAHGQRRLLEMAMALAGKPRVLLLDEPMAGLGFTETRNLMAVIAALKPKMAILLVEHDMDVVFKLADVVTVLVDGAVIASGPPAAIRDDAAVRRAYLSEGDDAC